MNRLFPDGHEADLLIIAALDEELNALFAYLKSDEVASSSYSANTYYLTCLLTKEPDISYRVAVTCIFGMGTQNAAVVAATAIAELRPVYVIMFGLAAGIPGKVQLADVIVSTQFEYYEQAKLLEQSQEVRPNSYRPDDLLLRRMQNFAAINRFPFGVEFGPFAIGEKVVANSSFVAALKARTPKLIGIEMESTGAAAAAAAAESRPRFIAVRGVSDFADEHKNDNCRSTALDNAAQFLTTFLSTGCLPVRFSNSAVTPVKNVIVIHHLSLERRPFPADFIANRSQRRPANEIIKVDIDQTDFFKGGSVTNPEAAFAHQHALAERIHELVRSHDDVHVAYFGLAHIPFVFHAGYQLGRREIDVYATDRQTGKWSSLLPNTPRDAAFPVLNIEGLPHSAIDAFGCVVVRVSVSALVTLEQVHTVIQDPLASIHLFVEHPALDLVGYEDQLASYTLIFRSTLDQVHRLVPNAEVLHLFFAGPPTLAFRCGQQVSKTMDPEVCVHNFSGRDLPNYRWSLYLHRGQIVDRQR